MHDPELFHLYTVQIIEEWRFIHKCCIFIILLTLNLKWQLESYYYFQV